MELLAHQSTSRCSRAARAVLLLLVLAAAPSLHAKGIYQTGPDFVAEAFAPATPEAKSLWLTPELKQASAEILDHALKGLRVRYWQQGEKTAWILEEIGKELPITIGVVVNDNSVEVVKILAFRESRGWEVRYPSFTDQYRQAELTETQQLDKSIDGITGATLSVRAVSKVVRLALLFHQETRQDFSQQAGDDKTS